MRDGVDFKITGADQLAGKLSSIKDDIRRKGGRAALRKAAQIVEKAAIEQAKKLDDAKTPNKIWEHITVQWSNKRFRRTGDLMFRIGVEGGARQYANTADNRRAGRVGKSYELSSIVWYWRLLEFGTERIRATPFMRPALTESIAEVTNTFVSEYDKSIDRAIKRAAKKTASS
ncbi:HK97-gp10 family putative phage morphogenesis protein [Pseudomonas sp. YQ_13]|uniref:HK97-gp10 family putative phage morphogenesis protein n=1 Tax=Pseudomonas sp. YQ_13 TaxID=3367235 RepID=UPI00370B6621